MTRVLLLGESWFVYSVHQKGFDTFYTSEFTLGGAEFVDALRQNGHEVTHIPAHEISTRMPTTSAQLAEIADVIVISDVGANTFQLAPNTFNHSIPGPDLIGAVRDFAQNGGGVLMVGGYMTFSGIDAKARWGRTSLASVLPVEILDRDDRVEIPTGLHPKTASRHPITEGLEDEWPVLLGLNELIAKPNSQTLAVCGEYPLLVIGTHKSGRTAAFASDLAPHWASPAFMSWVGYRPLFDRLINWLAGDDPR
jgi:uncharacterized membrane protein